MEDQTRNLNPHKAARLAMIIWRGEYAKQGGGSMDFWDKIGEAKRQQARHLLKGILEAKDEDWTHD